MPMRSHSSAQGFEMVGDAKLHQFTGQMLSDLGGGRPRIEHRADTGLKVSRGGLASSHQWADVACQANNLTT